MEGEVFMTMVWCVKVGRSVCVWNTLTEAWGDFKSHDNALIYPKIMSKNKLNSLKEFTGW